MYYKDWDVEQWSMQIKVWVLQKDHMYRCLKSSKWTNDYSALQFKDTTNKDCTYSCSSLMLPEIQYM